MTTSLAAFNQASPNGTWSLYAIDRGVGDIGDISSGWSLSVDTYPVTNISTAIGYPTIPDAIADPLTVDGNVIAVSAGSYTIGIGLDKALTLQGPNASVCGSSGSRVAEAVIQPTGAGNTAIRIATTGPVTIDGFTFTGTGNPIDSYLTGNTPTIQNNIFQNTVDGSMFFANSNVFTFDCNYLTNLSDCGSCEGMFLAGNWDGATGTQAVITNNVFKDTPSSGMNLSSVKATITGNTFTNVQYYAALLANNSAGTTVSGNVFTDIKNPDPPGVPSWGAGVRFYTPSVSGPPVTITGNRFLTSYNGVAVRKGSPTADITGMPISVTGNDFVGNTFAIRHDGLGTLEATCNWYGDISGPNAPPVNAGSGDAVSGPVLFHPWLNGSITGSPACNQTIQHTITPVAGAGGSITPGTPTLVPDGGSQVFDIAANTCFTLSDVKVDGNSQGAVASYTFTNVVADHTIEATFSQITYTITASASTGGTINPPGITTVGCGNDQVYSIAPWACYAIADVKVDGNSQGAVASYTFPGVVTNHTIEASFSPVSYTIDASAGTGGVIIPDGSISVPCQAVGTLYGSTTNGAAGASDFYLIDPTNGTPTLVGPTNFNRVGAMAIDPVSGVLYATAQRPADNAPVLITINPANGAGTEVGPTFMDGSVSDLSFRPSDNVLFANTLLNRSTGEQGLYTVNTGSGAATLVGSQNLFFVQGNGTAFTPSGTLYSATQSSLYILNQLTGAATPGPALSYPPLGDTPRANALAFDPSGVLYASVVVGHFPGGGATLCRIDVATGAVTAIGATQPTIDALAIKPTLGGDQSFEIKANACYTIGDVTVDGVSRGPLSAYTFNNVIVNHTIHADFTQLGPYAITTISTPAAGGSVSGPTSVGCGDPANYTIAANSCFTLDDVKVDGVSHGAVTTYSFTDVQADHTIEAIFSANGPLTITIVESPPAGGTVSGPTSVPCGTDAAYTISANSCYTISDVNVDGVSQGVVSSYTFTGVTTDHTITASFTPITYTITVTPGVNGTIAPPTGSVNCGDSPVYTITPDACYHIADVLVDNVSQGTAGTYTFTDVQANHTIAAGFAIDTYTITVNQGANGTIAPPTGSVNCGTSPVYTITPDACYHIVDVLVDNVSQGTGSSYTFASVGDNHTITASFAINTYTIDTQAGPNGSIVPTGPVGVSCGDNPSFTIAADPCYHIEDVVVDNVSQGPVAYYVFANVSDNHTIKATFASGVEIQVMAGTGGSISPPGPVVVVSCGANQTFTITPDPGNGIVDVTVDGVPRGPVSTYTFTNVMANHTIVASFLDLPTPAVITKLGAEPTEDGLRIHWAVESGSFSLITLERAESEVGPWTELNAARSQDGMLTVVLDRSVSGGRAYWYRLIGVTTAGTKETFGPVRADAVEQVKAFALSRVTPTPCNGPFSVTFAMAREAHVHLGLLDVQGREVAVLTDGVYHAGRYHAAWDGAGSRGQVPMGVYFLRMSVAGETFTERVIIAR